MKGKLKVSMPHIWVVVIITLALVHPAGYAMARYGSGLFGSCSQAADGQKLWDVSGELEGELPNVTSLKQITLVVLNRLCLDDLIGMAGFSLDKLVAMGGIALMNTRTGGGLTPENAFTTLGGGSRLVGAAGAKLALPVSSQYHDEYAGDIYRRRTGWEAASDSIVVLEIESIKANNLASIGTDRIGVIGEALREVGEGAALIGNSDSNECQRWAALIAMDGRGQVTMGGTGSDMNHLDPSFPTGRRTDLEALWQAYLAIRPKAQFIVVDLGDLDRVEGERKQLVASLYRSYREEALNTADEFLQMLLETVDLNREWVVVVSPMPTGGEIAGGRLLTPVILAGPGITPGLLVSKTTRRPGVVANYDIAPSVLAWLELPRPQGLPGALLTTARQIPQVALWGKNMKPSPIDATYTTGDSLLEPKLAYLQDVLTRSAATYRQRPPLLRAFVTLEVVIYLTAFVLVAVFPSLPREWISFGSFALLLVAAMPLALLILPILQPTTVVMAFLYTLVIALVLASVAWNLASSTETKYGIICGLTAMGLFIDICRGGPLVKFSPLGYDVMLGARFYGIGNEYMGILVGSTLLFALVIRERWPRAAPIVLLWFLAVIFLLASPGLGANAGGTITALVAFLLAYGLRGDYQGRLKTVTLVFAILVVVLFLNLFPSVGAGSHVTRALRMIVQGDWLEIGVIVQRKLAMNWRLMRYSIWSKGLLVALGVMGILVYRPTPGVQAAMGEHPSIKGIVFSTIIASLVALVFNDSGVVAGATTSVYAAGLVLSMIMEQRAKGSRVDSVSQP